MPAQSLTETYTGNIVEWYVPRHTPGSLRVTCRGADGRRGGPTPNGRRGYGGSVRGYLNVAPGTKLYLIVGADGSVSSPPSFMAKGGQRYGDATLRGGCATEVWDGPTNADRIMVAGGGGGGASGSSSGSTRGFDGGLGIADGESSSPYAHGGTLSAPGAAGTITSGTNYPAAGFGGDGGNGGGNGSGTLRGGGGGGGYYGGGGGGTTLSSGVGGGGGSSWCDTGLFSSVDNVGQTNGTAQIIITWDGDEFWVPSTGWFRGHPWG